MEIDDVDGDGASHVVVAAGKENRGGRLSEEDGLSSGLVTQQDTSPQLPIAIIIIYYIAMLNGTLYN